MPSRTTDRLAAPASGISSKPASDRSRTASYRELASEDKRSAPTAERSPCLASAATEVARSAKAPRKASAVRGPTTPSAVRPCACWKANTASRVAPSKLPSAPGDPTPRAISVCWRARTASPRSPIVIGSFTAPGAADSGRGVVVAAGFGFGFVIACCCSGPPNAHIAATTSRASKRSGRPARERKRAGCR